MNLGSNSVTNQRTYCPITPPITSKIMPKPKRSFRVARGKGITDGNIYLIACGLIGDPTARVIGNGGPQKKNSYTLSLAQSSAKSFK